MIRLLVLFLVLPFLLFADEDRAYAKYKEAEAAQTPEARKKAFNESLAIYLQMETQSPSAKLCFDIANTYYQLSEYGYAILYYYKALKEEPRNELVLTNLQIAQGKAGVQASEPSLLSGYLLYLHYNLSHNEKAVFVLIMMLLIFTIWSVHIWQPQGYLPKMAMLCVWLALIVGMSLITQDYFSRPDAVIVKTQSLRRDAGEQYAPINANPVLAGTKVTVVSVEPGGNWMEVRLSSGDEGYISKEYARVI